MHYTPEELIKILIECGYLTQEDVDKGQEYAFTHRDELISVLMTQGYISGDIIAQAIAEHLKVPYIDLHAHGPDMEGMRMIPEELARKLRIVVTKKTADTISIASDAPNNPEIVVELSRLFQ